MSEKKTPWFPGDVKPARPGIYQRRFRSIVYAKWSGTEWKYAQSTPDRAALIVARSGDHQRPWRGLAQDPNGEPK